MSESGRMYIGVDGCPEGWIAVAYSDTGFESASFYEHISEIWEANRTAERILIDVPIGLREESSEPRLCDTAARGKLSPERHSSVFPTPVRAAAREDSYEGAKAMQEKLTDGSLNRQTWGITPKIDEVDRFLLHTPEARESIREAHPEVCFWAFADQPMAYSKTTERARGFWERVRALRDVEPDVYDHLWDVGTSNIGGRASNDDLLDAFAVALTARGEKCELRTLPESDAVEQDPRGLPMEIVYGKPD